MHDNKGNFLFYFVIVYKMVLIQTTEDNVKFYALNMLHDLAHDYTNSEERIKNLVIAYNEFFTQHGGFKQSSNILEKNENFMKS